MPGELQAIFTSGQTLYAVILNAAGQAFNGSGFETITPTDWPAYAVPLAEQNASGIYLGNIPASVSAPWSALILAQIGSTPSPDDAPPIAIIDSTTAAPAAASAVASSLPQDWLATQADIESQFGVENVRIWSQLDPTQSAADTTRIQAALDWSAGHIVSIFAAYGNYAVPLAPLGTDVVIVQRWAAILAGVWLYQSRGLRDNDAVGDHLTQLRQDVEQEMYRYRSTEKLNAARRWPTATSPTVG